MRCWNIALVFLLSFGMFACSPSKPAVTVDAPQADSLSSKNKTPPFSVPMDSVELLRKEIAHGSFLRALTLQSQGELGLAEQFLVHAHEADPENRFLAFSVLDLMDKRGASDAAEFAEKIKGLAGKKTSGQYALLGRVYGGVSNLDSALAYYKKAVDLNERDFRALYEYSLLLEIVREKEELSRVYGILLPQIGYPQSMLERQVGLLAEAKKDSALADLLGDVYEVRGDRAFLESRIRLLFGMKRYEEALSAVEEFRADSAHADDSLSIAFLVAVHVDLKQDTVALDSLKAIYKRHPAREFVLMDIALLETKLGMKEQAKIHWGRLAESDTYRAAANGMLSAYALADGDTVGAVGYLEKAYRADPARYRESLVAQYLNQKAFAKIYPILDEAIRPDAKRDSLRALLLSAGDLERVREFDREVSMDLAATHSEYGFILQMNADYLERGWTISGSRDSAEILRKKSSEHFIEAAQIGGENPQILFAYGVNLLAFRQVDSAIVVFKKIFEKNPSDAVAKNHLGYTLVDLNRSAEEVRWGSSLIDEALKLEPSSVAFMDSKAWALYREGKVQEALALMEKVESFAKEDSLKDMFYRDTSIFVHLAEICQSLGLNERSTGYYLKVLEIDPANANAKKQIELLKQAVKPPEPQEKTESSPAETDGTKP